MRILAIRGANLASLAEPFELDLTAEPLAGTGLFAITGDTGAGKSTILDALCLALYGTYPRASDRRSEKVRDASGETLQASDPRNIVRRGAATASAEVEFVGGDGIEYRATWAVRRARGKSSGNLQNAERKLERRDGSAVIATGIRDVNDAIAARSGFTFEEFRRAVLLAQGEFDALLMADEARRAELLEKITGTDIYSRISMRVFEETAERQKVIADMQLRREAIGVLDDEARGMLTGERQSLADKMTRVAADCERLRGELKRVEEIARARSNLENARALQLEARSAWEVSAEERARARRLDAVQPLRPLDGARAETRRRLEEAEEAARSARDAATLAVADAAKAKDASDRLLAQSAAADAEVKRWEPAWQEADGLDQRIVGAAKERDKSAEAATRARTAATRAAKELQELTDQRNGLARRHAEALASLAERAAHEPLAGERARLSQLLDTQVELQQRRIGVSKDTASAAASAQELERRVGDVEKRTEAATAARDTAAQRLAERRAVLRAMNAAALDAREQALGSLVTELVSCREAARRREEALRAGNEASQALGAANDRRADEASAYAAAQEAQTIAAAAREEAGRMADLAEATLSQQAGRLRSTLVDGEACPVCGAKEHPFANDHGAAGELARELKRNRKEREEQLQVASTALTRANAALAATDAEIEQARRQLEPARLAADESLSEISEILPRLEERLVAAGSSRILPDAGRLTRGDVVELEKWAEAERRANEQPRRQAIALSEECDGLQKSHDEAARTLERLQLEIQEDRKELAEMRAKLAALVATQSGIEDRLVAVLVEIEPFLALADVTPTDIERDAEGVRKRLEKLGDVYAKASASRDETARQLAEIDAAVLAVAPRHEAAAYAANEVEKQLAERTNDLDELTQSRAKLLDGERTAVHRDRVRATVRQLSSALASAQTTAGEAQNQVTERKTREVAARERLLAATGDCNRAEDTWIAALGRLGFGAEGAAALLAVTEAERLSLAERIGGLRDALQKADATLRTRELDLGERIGDGTVPDADAIALLAKHMEERTTALEDLGRRLASTDADLTRDAEARGRAAGIDAEIAGRRADLATWQAVDEAIGQKDGAKFRRFAQGVTLGHLVALANVQLAALAPRYRLARGALSDLAFDVIDRDLGEEARAPRSLSGGERFLVSLALALALSGLEGRQSFVDTLFIDEGFGALDRETLDMAIDVLESLQGRGRKVGVITHVPAMMDRIAVQVRVVKRGGGRSVVRVGDSNERLDRAPVAG